MKITSNLNDGRVARKLLRVIAGFAVVFAGAGSTVLVGTMALDGLPNAGAATVPNMMACTRATGHCFQVNGRYVVNVPVECWWTNRTGPYSLYYTLCDRWVPTPKGY